MLDVAQMLLASVKGVSATRTKARRRCGARHPPRRPHRRRRSSPRAQRRAVEPLRWLRRAPWRPSRSLRRPSRAAPSSTTTPAPCSATRGGRQAPGHRGEVRGRGDPGRRGQDGWLAVRRRRLALRHPGRGGDQAPSRARGRHRGEANRQQGRDTHRELGVGDPRGHVPVRRRRRPSRSPEGRARRGPGTSLSRPSRRRSRHSAATIPEGRPSSTSASPNRSPRAARARAGARTGRDPGRRAAGWSVGDDIPEGQSLFDVGRPDPVELSRQATAAASDDPETILDADDEPDGRARATEPEPEEKPKPRPPARPTPPAPTPNINEAGSLFDL